MTVEPWEYDNALVNAVNETEAPSEAPPVAERANLARRLGYSSEEELGAVVGLAASTIRSFSEGRDAGLFESTLRKLTKIAAAVDKGKG
jgi:hypothetical protein